MRTGEPVVVTGLGVVSPNGIGTDAFWKATIAGRSGVRAIRRFHAPGLRCRAAGEIEDFDPFDYFPRGKANRTDRYVQFGLVAAREAVQQSGATAAGIPPHRIGVLAGTGIGGIESYEEQLARLADGGPGRVSPFTMPRVIPNMLAAEIAIEHGSRGPCLSISSACATGTQCVGEAMKIIQAGRADVMICGASEAALTQLIVAAFESAGVLSTRECAPEQASRPFDASRDGFVPAEGAAILVLEAAAHARARGAAVLAELAGYATNCDAYHITRMNPDGEAIARVMADALVDASIEPAGVGYLNAHGTATLVNDRVETRAIKAVFGRFARSLSISSTKSTTGHLLGASGALEAVATVLALRDQQVPPTINCENPDPECDLDYTPGTAVPRAMNYAMSCSYGFGGHNACLVFRSAS